MNYGFLRVATITPKLKLADVSYNAERIIEKIEACNQKGVQVAVFPELCLCGYTCADLFLQSSLLLACKENLLTIVDRTKDCKTLVFLGMPLEVEGKLYDVAVAFQDGKILAVCPKKTLKSYGDIDENRYFSTQSQTSEVTIDGVNYIPFGNDIILQAEGSVAVQMGVEFGNDLFSPNPPSSALTSQGATVILCLDAVAETVTGKENREMLIKSQSMRCLCGYAYASAGTGESTTDGVFAGYSVIAEKGKILAENTLFNDESIVISEIDTQKIVDERKKFGCFNRKNAGRKVFFPLTPHDGVLNRKIPQSPFIPASKADFEKRAERILSIQANALARRLEHTRSKTAIIGISGGLDSTLALLVTARAFDILKKDRKDIIAITMPGFGTTGKTYRNALKFMACVGVTVQEISIKESVLQHFQDIEQPENCFDATYENAQARMRTLILMDMANKENGLVIGTGDLSELALGWCTYNGDHMSMYAVNASVPKTLMRHLVAFIAKKEGGELEGVLRDILSTAISPELLPPDKEGKIAQKTEDLVGPYELHDFFIYYAVRYGFTPKKVLYLAENAFAGKYDSQTLKKWLINFYRRFFSQQFKRSCSPDGVKVGSLTLSPRGGYRMPSDGAASLWLKELEE